MRGRWLVLIAAGALALGQCKNAATGVDACKQIEQERCALVAGCPPNGTVMDRPIVDDRDVAACQLFYRDECLLGMADGADPNDTATAACLAALNLAAGCKGATLDGCQGAPALAAGAQPKLLSGCDVLLQPELLAACSFLQVPNGAGGSSPSTSASSAGGNGGAAGASAGGAGGH